MDDTPKMTGSLPVDAIIVSSPSISSSSTLPDPTTMSPMATTAANTNMTLSTAYRKIDWAIMPLMFLCYFLQFLDKVVINYANIMGLSTDLHFRENDFSWMATAFFIAYAVAEVPQGVLIQRFPVSRVLGANVVLWGVVVCCTAAVGSFVQATTLRTLLGALEAVITPALIMITAQWYTRRQATPRTGVWYCGLGVGQLLGGFISWAAQHGAQRAGELAGWRIMFLAVGAFNLLVGLVVMLWMPSGVDEARRRGLLNNQEARAVEKVLAADQVGGTRCKRFRVRGLVEALTDMQVWLLCLNSILIVIPAGIITTFSATVIHNLGYGSRQAALLNMPSGVVSILATLMGTCAVGYNFPRWLAICLLLVPAIIGAALMSFCADSQPAALAGMYLINFDVAPLALIYALVGANTQGYTKRVATSGAVAVGLAAANIIGPLTFQARDAPGYLPAKVTVFAVCGGSMVVTIGLRVLYGARNRRTAPARRAAEAEGGGEATEADLGEDLTDRTNPAFRYVY